MRIQSISRLLVKSKVRIAIILFAKHLILALRENFGPQKFIAIIWY